MWKTVCFFQIVCCVHVHDDDDADDNDDVAKNVQSNSTAPWNWVHEPNPQHGEKNHDVCGIGSRKTIPQHLETNSTEPWNLIVTLKPHFNGKIISTTNWTKFTDRLNKFHGAMELV